MPPFPAPAALKCSGYVLGYSHGRTDVNARPTSGQGHGNRRQKVSESIGVESKAVMPAKADFQERWGGSHWHGLNGYKLQLRPQETFSATDRPPTGAALKTCVPTLRSSD